MSVTLQNNGLYWSYGSSKIYDDSQLNISSDDFIFINCSTFVQIPSGGLYVSGYYTGWNSAIMNDWFISSDNARYGYLRNSGAPGVQATNNTANYGGLETLYGMFVKHRICCGDELDVASDVRIKKNINNINSEKALNIIRNLEPKEFNYIDYLNNNKKTNYGFIAQEVNEIFSDAITKRFEFIPNIYDSGILKDSNTIFLDNKLTNILNLNNEKTFIKIFINNKEKIVSLKEILDDKTFIINEKIEETITDNLENKIFIYGVGVNDFLVLEKNSIFTLNTVAIKQIDKEIQEIKSILNYQKTIIDTQQKEIDDLKKQLNCKKI